MSGSTYIPFLVQKNNKKYLHNCIIGYIIIWIRISDTPFVVLIKLNIEQLCVYINLTQWSGKDVGGIFFPGVFAAFFVSTDISGID